MGQQQISSNDQTYHYNKSSNEMLRQADLWYMKDKFAVSSNYNKYKFIHSQLLKEALCEDDCEIVNFFYKKITGQLSCKKGEKEFSISSKVDDSVNVIINNYYNVDPKWQNPVEW